ncbi:MAG: HAMP domain-containing protein [Spirochaetaceae bacterium]|nr:MAG: HAMP domain-containing protein [Spirochaetaceae bacterium]
MRRTLLYQLYPVYLIALVVAIGALTFAAQYGFRNAFYGEKQHELHNTAVVVANSITVDEIADSGRIRAIVDRLGRDVPNRITIMRPDGEVIGDSFADPGTIENHSDRPEFRSALETGSGTDIRVSATVGLNSMYAAVLIRSTDGTPAAVVRIAGSVTHLDARSREFLLAIVLAAVVIVAAAVFFALVMIARIHRPLRDIRAAAARYAEGDLRHRISIRRAPDDIVEIADTLNDMAHQLADTIGSITRQRNELEKILTSMVEGVIVVDSDRTIRSMNRAAAGMFALSPVSAPAANDASQRRTILDVLRSTDLDAVAEKVLATGTPTEDTITIYTKPVRHLQVHGTSLTTDAGTGVLLVLNDITRLRRLEEVRQDFVANVSHELKTPITTILGFVETLRDGAIEDTDSAPRFLEIVHSSAIRLSLIVEDLLSLSRLEALDATVPLESCSLREIVEKSIEACSRQAREKRIDVQAFHDGPDYAELNRTLLEQALINLVDNAIKFSPTGSTVKIDTKVEANTAGSSLVLSVSDRGHGIPRKDLPRIFERFYRVDRARSREMGGTGLGLAIVKHIAIAHHGEVTAESREGHGSTFTIRIPHAAR